MMSRKALKQVKAGENIAKKNGSPAIKEPIGEQPTGLGNGLLSSAVAAIRRNRAKRNKQLAELMKD